MKAVNIIIAVGILGLVALAATKVLTKATANASSALRG